jgi:flagellar protein FliO/FliZ
VPYDVDDLTSLSLTIAILVLLLWGAIWLVRRMRPGAVSLWDGRDCAVIRSLALGPRERLVVVRVGSRQLVVGVGSASVSLLCELDEPLPPAGGAVDHKFGEAIRKAVGRWRGG